MGLNEICPIYFSFIPVLNGRHILKNLWKAITTRNETEIDWTDLIKTHPTLHVVGLNHFSQKKLRTVDMKEQTTLPMQSESAKYGMNFRKLSAEFSFLQWICMTVIFPTIDNAQQATIGSCLVATYPQLSGY